MKWIGFIVDQAPRSPSHKTGIFEVNAENIWITEYEKVINNLTDILWDEELATHSTRECYNTAINPRHCVKSLLWVSNSEWTQFKSCYKNNCLWIMYKGKIKSYPSIKANISDWVSKYNKYWYKLKTPQERLSKSKYCTSGCENWVSNYNDWIKDFIYK